MDPNSLACVSCQSVTTNDGRTVWVCENCRTVNAPSGEQLVQSAPSTPQVPAPPPTLAPDESAAQAALDEAAQAVSTAPAAPPMTTPVMQSTPPNPPTPGTHSQ